MTVSTEYFDFVFNTKTEVASNLTKAVKKLAKLERKQDRLEGLVDDRASVKRLRRLEKQNALVAAKEAEIDELIGRSNTLEAVELPKDEVTYSLWAPTDDVTGIQVTITDSPYDDSFVGGQKTTLYLSGSGRKTSNGTGSFGTRSSLISEDFADGTDTFGIAGFGFASKVDGSYPDVTVSLLQGYNLQDDGNYSGSPESSYVQAVYTDSTLII